MYIPMHICVHVCMQACMHMQMDNHLSTQHASTNVHMLAGSSNGQAKIDIVTSGYLWVHMGTYDYMLLRMVTYCCTC